MAIRKVLNHGRVRYRASVTRGGRCLRAYRETLAEARQAERELYQQLVVSEVRSCDALVAWLGPPAVDLAGEFVHGTLRRPMVYVWINSTADGDQVLYVGMSADGLSRPIGGTHHRRADIGSYARLLCWPVASPEEAERVEAEVIRRCNPRFNVQRNGSARHVGPALQAARLQVRTQWAALRAAQAQLRALLHADPAPDAR